MPKKTKSKKPQGDVSHQIKKRLFGYCGKCGFYTKPCKNKKYCKYNFFNLLT